MWKLLITSLLFTAWMTACQAVDQPSVQLGDTTIVGNSFQRSNVEFFGRDYSFSDKPERLRFVMVFVRELQTLERILSVSASR